MSQTVILSVFDVAFCNAFYWEIDTTHITMIIPKKFYLKIVMPHGQWNIILFYLFIYTIFKEGTQLAKG